MDWPHGPSRSGAAQDGTNLSHQTTRSLGSSSFLGVGYSCRNFGTRILANIYDWLAHSRVVRRANCGGTHRYCKPATDKCAVLDQELDCEWFAWWRWRGRYIPANHGHLFCCFWIARRYGLYGSSGLRHGQPHASNGPAWEVVPSPVSRFWM